VFVRCVLAKNDVAGVYFLVLQVKPEKLPSKNPARPQAIHVRAI
jgi:hypothetical protein